MCWNTGGKEIGIQTTAKCRLYAMLFTCDTSNSLGGLFLAGAANCLLPSALASTSRGGSLPPAKCYNSLLTNEKESIRPDANHMHRSSTLNITEVEKSGESRRERDRYLPAAAALLITRLLATVGYRWRRLRKVSPELALTILA